MKLNTGKMSIPRELPLLSRQRLIDALWESSSSGCATIISGRTGTGKTSLATDFARNCNRPVAWYKVDAPDTNLPIFLEYLVASIAVEREGFGVKTLRQLPEIVTEAALTKLVESFVYDLENEAESLLLVIDDLHLIYDAGWLSSFFHRLLPLLPTEVHMLILGRGLPPAPLWRLRSKQRLFVLDESMLAFTEAEAAELFAFYGLSVHQARLSHEITGGRASELCSAALRARSSLAGAVLI